MIQASEMKVEKWQRREKLGGKMSLWKQNLKTETEYNRKGESVIQDSNESEAGV